MLVYSAGIDDLERNSSRDECRRSNPTSGVVGPPSTGYFLPKAVVQGMRRSLSSRRVPITFRVASKAARERMTTIVGRTIVCKAEIIVPHGKASGGAASGEQPGEGVWDRA